MRDMWVVKVGNPISLCDVWLSLSLCLPSTLSYSCFFLSKITALLCFFFVFLLLLCLHLSCLVNVTSNRVQTCPAEDHHPDSAAFLSPLTCPRIPTRVPKQPDSSSFPFCSPALASSPLCHFRAECCFQSQGPGVSTPLTLGEPCLRLEYQSACVCVLRLCMRALSTLCKCVRVCSVLRCLHMSV